MPNPRDTQPDDERRFVRRPPAQGGDDGPARPATPPRTPQTGAQGPAQRPTAGAPPAAGPASQDTLDRDVKALAGRLTELETRAQLASLHSAVQRTTADLAGLPAAVAALRSQGYLYGNTLEGQVESLASRWEPLRREVLRQAQSESASLGQEVRAVANRVQTLQTSLLQSAAAARSLYPPAVTAVDGLTAKIQASESRLGGLHSDLSRQVYVLKRQVDGLAAVLKEFQTATFHLQPGESPLDTTPATYLRDRDEGPKGLLYLTNQRILFEQKEEVATKKVLFVTTSKELIQRLLLDQPVGYIQQVEGAEKGAAVFKKELLTIRFAPEAGVGTAQFQLKEDSTVWQALLRRVISGELEGERLGAKPEEAAARADAERDAVRRLPSVCPTCGAPLGQRVVRGVVSLSCDYCGAAIRV